MSGIKKKYITTSERGTLAVARKLAARLSGGSVVGLEGPLGAGKTIFAKGLGQGLGVDTIVNSPTFVVMNVYDLHRQAARYFVHVDCYRLSGSDEAAAIGLSDYLERPDSIVVVEWAEKIASLLPQATIRVSLNPRGKGREIRIASL